MKIRNGFVSNSSSSSFVIIGQKMYHQNLLDKPETFDGNAIYTVVGKYLNEGRDVFTLTKGMLDAAVEYNNDKQVNVFDTNGFEVFKNAEVFTEYDDKSTIGQEIFTNSDTLCVRFGTSDNNNTQDKWDFIRTYLSNI